MSIDFQIQIFFYLLRKQVFFLKNTSPFNIRPPLEIFIDGPYGAPSSAIFNGVDHAVLVATGIGVTPFASILQSIMHKYWESKKQCPNCSHAWSEGIQQRITMKKVDFVWINR